MAKFVKGEVVVVPFPFSNLSQAKRRPALVMAVLAGDDIILCQITSQIIRDEYAITIGDDDFETGELKQISNIRPNRLFTSDSNIVLYRVGILKKDAVNKVVEKVIEIISN